MHDMVTLGRKANTKCLGTILPTDGWTDNLIPVTTPPHQLVAGGYNYDKRLPSHSKYSNINSIEKDAFQMFYI